jgi:outer membrane protein assembly factor BamB
VLTRRHVFVTGFEDGKLYTQCFDRETGQLLWERAVDRARIETVNTLNHPAAITPVVDGENVYAFFYEYGILSYSPAGELRWEVRLGPFSNSMGHSSCPILAGGNVIVVLDQMAGSYVAAFDQNSGELRWQTSREEMEGWATPLVYRPSDGPPVVVTASRGQLGAHRLADGKRLWSRPRLPPSVVASPILDENTLYTLGYGYDTLSPFAAQLEEYDKNRDGKLSPDEYGQNAYLLGIGRFGGDKDGVVTQQEWEARQRLSMAPSSLLSIRLEPGATAAGDGQSLTKELWRYEKSFVGVVPSPLLYEGVLYLVKNGGILTTFDAKTGETIKAGRVAGALGPYSASPVAAEGKVFLASEEGKVTVLKASREWEVMTINDLAEGCFATPALAGGRIYLRTSEALYCFSSSMPAKPPAN